MQKNNLKDKELEKVNGGITTEKELKLICESYGLEKGWNLVVSIGGNKEVIRLGYWDDKVNVEDIISDYIYENKLSQKYVGRFNVKYTLYDKPTYDDYLMKYLEGEMTIHVIAK